MIAMSSQHQQEDSEINPRRQKHKSKHRRKGNKCQGDMKEIIQRFKKEGWSRGKLPSFRFFPIAMSLIKQQGPALHYHVINSDKMTRNRLTKFGLFAFGKTSTKVVREPYLSEEHEARANADLQQILDLANPSTATAPAVVPNLALRTNIFNTTASAAAGHGTEPEPNVSFGGGRKTRTIRAFGGNKLPESPMSLCRSASQEPCSADKVNLRPLQDNHSCLQTKASKSRWSSSSGDDDESSLWSSPDALRNNPAHYLPQVADELFKTIRAKLDELFPRATDYFTEKRQILLRAHRQSVKQYNLSRISTFPVAPAEASSQDIISGTQTHCPLPGSQVPPRQRRTTPKKGVLYAMFQIFDEPAEDSDSYGHKVWQSGPRHHQDTTGGIVPLLFCSDRRAAAPGQSCFQSSFKMIDPSIEISLIPNHWYKVHLVEGPFSGRMKTSVQTGWSGMNDVIHLWRNREPDMNVLDYAEVSPEFECPMQTTPTVVTRVNQDLERTARFRPLPNISPISIPPYQSPEFKYYRHMLY